MRNETLKNHQILCQKIWDNKKEKKSINTDPLDLPTAKMRQLVVV